jgi:hypothetical protein
MSSLLLGAATIIAMATSVVLVKAADLAYPPPLAAPPPQYGELAPPPAIMPPRVIIVPGPAVVPHYNGAPVPPLVVGPSYGDPPPVAAGVPVAPRQPCAPVCGECGWRAGCTPHPESYPTPYDPLGPQAYPGPQTPSAAEPYSERYAPRVYSGPIDPYRAPYRP